MKPVKNEPVESKSVPTTSTEASVKKFRLNFNKQHYTLDGEPAMELRPGYKGTYAEIKDSDYLPSTLNRILGRALANSSEDFGGKEFEWYPVLYNSGVLELDSTDARRLKDFITSKRKGEGAFSNLIVKALFDVFKAANFTE